MAFFIYNYFSIKLSSIDSFNTFDTAKNVEAIIENINIANNTSKIDLNIALNAI